MKIIYMEQTLQLIAREKGVATANELVAMGTIQSKDKINYLVITK